MTGPARPIARQVLTELDVAALTTRITDPERTRVVVVVTSGNRAPVDRLDADRIAAEVGADVEVVTLPTGALTYALERGLPDETNVFGDAARTYPVGTAWHARPHLSPLRYCRADTDASRLQAQVISDARAAGRRATESMNAATRAGQAQGVTRARGGPLTAGRPMATPATLPGGRSPRPGSDSGSTPTSAVEPAARASSPAPARNLPTVAPAGGAGPTPANPRGAPTRGPHAAAVPSSPSRVTRAPAAPRAAQGRLSESAPWHATSSEDGRSLAQYLMATRDHPVLVVSTPSEDAGPLIDADDLHRRVHEIADVVVLHNGPASWAPQTPCRP